MRSMSPRARTSEPIEGGNPQGRGEVPIAGSASRTFLKIETQLGTDPPRLPEEANTLGESAPSADGGSLP